MRVCGAMALPIVGRVFLGLGLIGFVAAAVLALLESHNPRTGHAEGTVLAAARYPAINFTTTDGKQIQFRSRVKNGFLHTGDHVGVVYDPQSPADAQVDGMFGRWFPVTLAIILGAVFALAGTGLTIAGRIVLRRARPRLTGAWLRRAASRGALTSSSASRA